MPRHAFLSRRRVLAGGAVTAGLAAAAAIAFESGLADALTSDYHTTKGELRSVTLADNSRVELDADSALSVAFTDRKRRITLQRGRALFTVAKDAARPFSVVAAGGVTTALGTEFVVDCLPDSVTVSVIESAVMVAAPGGVTGAAAQTQVTAGQQVSYSRDGVGAVAAMRGTAETAWRQGRLVFENEPLGDVIAAVNRYRSGTIVVWNRALLGSRVSGAFDVRDPDQVLDAIRQTLPVQTFELTRYLVLLRPA